MAIKIQCTSCGCQNDLGRVFCAQCGLKLDLRATTAQDLEDRRETDISGLVRKILTGVAFLAIFTVIGLACWPVSIPVVLVDPSGAVQIPMKAKALKAAISYNRGASLSLTEGELNGFLQERAKIRKVDGLAIDLKPGAFDLYAARSFTPPTNITAKVNVKVKVPFSVGMRGAFQAGVMTVEGARIGHLPLPGFARDAIVKYFESLFTDVTREKRIVSALKSVAIEETRADLVVGP